MSLCEDGIRPWTPRSCASGCSQTFSNDCIDAAPQDCGSSVAIVAADQLMIQEGAAAELVDTAVEEDSTDASISRGHEERKAFRRLLGRGSIYFESYPRDVVMHQALEIGMHRSRTVEGADILWFEADPPSWGVITSMRDEQRINTFLGMKLLATKCAFARAVGLAKSLLKDSSQRNAFHFFPETWIMPLQAAELRAHVLETQGTRRDEVYVVKPDDGCGGDGIYLTTDINNIRHNRCIVQSYISRPLLLGGLKFDMRIYIVVMSLQPLRYFVHKEGLARFAVEPYDVSPSSLYKLNMHLTNYSLNKFSSSFVHNVDSQDDTACSKRTLRTTFTQLKAAYGDAFDEDEFWQQVVNLADVTLTTMLPFLLMAVKDHNNVLSNCFQIMGFDVLLDDSMQAHLLEVNHHPSLLTDAPVDSLVKGCLLKHALRMVAHGIALKRQEDKKKAGGRKQKQPSAPDDDDTPDPTSAAPRRIAVPTDRAEWEINVCGPLFIPCTSTLHSSPLTQRYVQPLDVLREVFLANAGDARARLSSACTFSSLKFSKFCRRLGFVPSLLSSAEADLMFLKCPKDQSDGSMGFTEFVHLCMEGLGDVISPETQPGTSARLDAVARELRAFSVSPR